MKPQNERGRTIGESHQARMRRYETLTRRAKLRRAINARSGPDGFQNAQEIADYLGASKMTVLTDLKEIGAVKVRDRIDGPKYVDWWIIPAYNPLLPDYREGLDETLLMNEISLKIQAHVIEMFVIRSEIVVKTERSAGPLMADWLSLLPWPEILHVTEERSSCVLHAPDAEDAQWIRDQLIGGSPEPEEES